MINKAILGSVLAAAVVGFTFSLLFTSPAEEESYTQLKQSIEKLAAQGEFQGKQIAQLEIALKKIKRAVVAGDRSVAGARTDYPESGDHLLARIEKIENTLGLIGDGNQSPLPAIEPEQTFREQLAEKTPPSTLSFYRGEEQFQADYGVPIGDREKVLESVFSDTAENVALQNVQCKSSICKVTYRLDSPGGASSSEVNESNAQLLSGITAGYVSGNLDVIQGTDPNGNRVLYIKEH